MRWFLSAMERQDTEKYEFELTQAEKRLVELETQFMTRMDGLLERKVLTGDEFIRTNKEAE